MPVPTPSPATAPAAASASGQPRTRAGGMLAALAPSTTDAPRIVLHGFRPCFDYFVRPDALTVMDGEIVPVLGQSFWLPGLNGNGRAHEEMGLGARTKMQAEGWIWVPHTIGDVVEFTAFDRPRRGSDFDVSHYVEVVERRDDRGTLMSQVYHSAWDRPVALGAAVIWETDRVGRRGFLTALRDHFFKRLTAHQIQAAVRPTIEAVAALSRGPADFYRRAEMRRHVANIPAEHMPPDLKALAASLAPDPLSLADLTT